jgi:hypothetical protein
VYHAVRPAPCRGKRGPASGTCARCTGRPELALSSLAGTAMSLIQMSDGLRQMLAARPPGSAVPGGHHAAPAAPAELARGKSPATELDAELCELAQENAPTCQSPARRAFQRQQYGTILPANYRTSYLMRLPIPRRGCGIQRPLPSRLSRAGRRSVRRIRLDGHQLPQHHGLKAWRFG